MHESDASVPTTAPHAAEPAPADAPNVPTMAPDAAVPSETAATSDVVAPAEAPVDAGPIEAGSVEAVPVEAAAPAEAAQVEAAAEAVPVEEAAPVELAELAALAEPAAASEPVAAEPPPQAELAELVQLAGPIAPADAQPAPADATAAPTSAAPTSAAPANAPPANAPPKAKGPTNDERRARAELAWELVLTARESGDTLTGMVTSAVKGGLLVDLGGIRGFLPASQTRVPQGSTIEALVRTKVPLKVIDIDQERRRAVVSQRRALSDDRSAKRRELLASLVVGQVREGTVVRLTDFGAFVDLGGIDGLIPMRELAFERIDKAGDVVTVGEKLPVEVLRIDEGGKKISLSRRTALPDPWRDHAALLQRGKTVEGRVVGKERGLSVELAPGVVGQVREDEINPDDYALGETVEVSVRNVDRTRRRIALTTLHNTPAAPQQQPSSPSQPATSSGFAPLGKELRVVDATRSQRRR